MSDLTAIQALDIVQQHAQWMRENGENDMRSIIYFISGIVADVGKGIPADKIIADRKPWEED